LQRQPLLGQFTPECEAELMVAAALAAGNHHQVTRRCRVEKAEQRPGQQQCQWHNPQVGAHEERGLSHSIHRESPWASPAVETAEGARAMLGRGCFAQVPGSGRETGLARRLLSGTVYPYRCSVGSCCTFRFRYFYFSL